jgi:putative nucleotidyltransferase with HDIG domain
MAETVAFVLSEFGRVSADVRRALGRRWTFETRRFSDQSPLTPGAAVVIDLDGAGDTILDSIRAWRATPDGIVAPLVLIGEQQDRRRLLERNLLRGANFIPRPLEADALLDLLSRHSARRFGGRVDARRRQQFYDGNPAHANALRACDDILDELFGVVASRQVIDVDNMTQRSQSVVDSLTDAGLEKWISVVRLHHDLTYQHCMLVTGTIVAFGQHLGVRAADQRELAIGGLLHDLGKASIPLEILDKPTSLTAEETEIMQKHPELGVARLREFRNAPANLKALVRDHHELLDGSGYPNGLMAESIPDLVRLLTIADIFAALIERRAYKAPLPAADAIDVMAGMSGKLDPHMFAALKPVMARVQV